MDSELKRLEEQVIKETGFSKTTLDILFYLFKKNKQEEEMNSKE